MTDLFTAAKKHRDAYEANKGILGPEAHPVAESRRLLFKAVAEVERHQRTGEWPGTRTPEQTDAELKRIINEGRADGTFRSDAEPVEPLHESVLLQMSLGEVVQAYRELSAAYRAHRRQSIRDQDLLGRLVGASEGALDAMKVLSTLLRAAELRGGDVADDIYDGLKAAAKEAKGTEASPITEGGCSRWPDIRLNCRDCNWTGTADDLAFPNGCGRCPKCGGMYIDTVQKGTKGTDDHGECAPTGPDGPRDGDTAYEPVFVWAWEDAPDHYKDIISGEPVVIDHPRMSERAEWLVVGGKDQMAEVQILASELQTGGTYAIEVNDKYIIVTYRP